MKLATIFALALAFTVAAAQVWDGTVDTYWYTDNTSATEYIITTPQQLAGFAELVNGGNSFGGKTVRLGADIALNNTANWQDWEITAPTNSWTAIGNSFFNSFGGTFNGDGHVISGVYINTTSSYQGLFGYLGSIYEDGGTIKNLGVVNSYVKGGNYVGGLVGNNCGTVTNNYFTGTVTGNNYVGGIVGQNSSLSNNNLNIISIGTVNNSYSTGTVTGNSIVGGLVGANGTGMVSNSYSISTVTGSDAVGGLVGSNNSTVSNSYSTGTVVGTGAYAGGLVGSSGWGTIGSCYSTGTVTGNSIVGGLVGSNNSAVSNSYSTGTVTGNSIVGGLVGTNSSAVSNSYSTGSVTGSNNSSGGLVGYNSTGAVSSSYYDSQTSGQIDIGKGEGKTTAEMQSLGFVNNLNFVASILSTNAWLYSAGKYPTLSNTPANSEINIASYFASGNGTEASPYIINTKEQLENLSLLTNLGKDFNGEYIKLGNNIALNGTQVNPWTAIGYFGGTFDGNGYVVSEVYINTTSDYQGLFGYLGSGGTIKNLGVVNSYVKGGNYVGGLVGAKGLGTVSNSYSIGTVTGNERVGGLVGYNLIGTISNSYSTGSVTGNVFVGGLVGHNGGTISNSYSTGTVTGNSIVGGLVGTNSSAVSNSYSTGTVTGNSDVGGLVGRNGGTISNSYYDKITSGQTDTGKGEGKTTVEMQSSEFVYYLNLRAAILSMNAWIYSTGNYPVLSNVVAYYFAGGDGAETNPYIISTEEQLEYFSAFVNIGRNFNGEYIKLGNDINLSGNEEKPWIAIGSSSNQFKGTFDGNGHIVSGIYINTTDSYQGLFGYLGLGGTIKNIGIDNSYVKGSDYVGGLVGYNNVGIISNSYFTGAVTGGTTGRSIGGLVGYNNAGTIKNSYSASTVTGFLSSAGGLVGENDYDGIISNSYSTGTLTGNVFVGGLVGSNYGTVNNSYSTCVVTGNVYVGGLVGYNLYAVNSSYYDSQTSGQTDTGKGIGKTTAEMQSLQFVNLLNLGSGILSMNAWDYSSGKYPVLSNMPADREIDFTSYFASGRGQRANPYVIKTKEQLENLSFFVNLGKDFRGEYFKLDNDIALNDTTNWQNWETTPPTNFWVKIGNGSDIAFRGTFDGNGHIISGVYINATSDYQGLFGRTLNGTIKNLGIVASYIKGYSYVGGLVGHHYGTISNSYFIGNITGIGNVGGLVGLNNDGSVVNSYFTGMVTGVQDAGGLVGRDLRGTVINSYYDKTTSGQTDTGKGVGKTTAEMKEIVTYADWDFETVWRINSTINNGYPYLLVKIIPTIADLNFTIPTDHIYSKTPQGIGEVTGTTGIGVMTVLYNGNTTVPTNAGTYAITVNIAEGTDFEAATGIELGEYEIAKASLVIAADNKTILAGTNEPSYTYVARNFVNGETKNVITVQPEFALDRSFNNNQAGTFVITPSGAIAANYDISYETGILTVTAKQTPIITDLRFTIPTYKVYNGTPQGIGEVIGKVAGIGAITVLYDGTTTLPTNAGTYNVTVNVAEGTLFEAASGIALGEYKIAKATHNISHISFDHMEVVHTGDEICYDLEHNGDLDLSMITYDYENHCHTAVSEDGHTVTIKFTSLDSINYHHPEDMTVLLKIAATQTPTIPNRVNPSIGSIGVQTIGNNIVLTNLPNNSKVEVYNLNGKRIHSVRAYSNTPMHIPVQTKGMYIVKVGTQTLRVTMR